MELVYFATRLHKQIACGFRTPTLKIASAESKRHMIDETVVYRDALLARARVCQTFD